MSTTMTSGDRESFKKVLSEQLFSSLVLARDAAASGDMDSFCCFSEASKAIASHLGEDAYDATAMAVYSIVADFSNLEKARRSESAPRRSEYSDIHTWVRTESGLGFEEGYVTRNNRKPDFVDTRSGRVVPVECKLVFKKRSLNQLLTYMHDMGVSEGFAVAFECEVDLPEGVRFIKVPEGWNA